MNTNNHARKTARLAGRAKNDTPRSRRGNGHPTFCYAAHGGQIHTGYQDISALSKFFSVSADYLFCLTDNRQHRHIEIDALSLSDEAHEMLKDEKLNNRLVSEVFSHADFLQLMKAIEKQIA